MVRVVFFVHFGSWRCACRPGILGLDWPEGFLELDRAVTRASAKFESLTYAQLAEPEEEDVPDPELPRIGEREGTVDIFMVEEEAETLRLLVVGMLPFKWWPWGGWCVLGGFRCWPYGHTEPLSDRELDEVW